MNGPVVGHIFGLPVSKGFDNWMRYRAVGVVAAVGVLATATITLLTTLGAVDWSGPQIAMVGAETGAGIAFLTALVAHFWPTTNRETVAVAGSFTALVTTTLTLGTGFVWWTISQAQESAIVAVVAATIGVIGAVLARHSVDAHPTS